MKILKKKRLGTIEVYVIFLSCIYAGFIGYKSLLNVLFTLIFINMSIFYINSEIKELLMSSQKIKNK